LKVFATVSRIFRFFSSKFSAICSKDRRSGGSEARVFFGPVSCPVIRYSTETPRVRAILSLALVFGMVLAGCDNGSTPASAPITYTVSFDRGDGSGTPPPVQTVEEGKTISLPGRGDMAAPAGKECRQPRRNNP
jgi:hypothetical protein